MADLHITEVGELRDDARHRTVQIPNASSIKSKQLVTFTTATASAAFNGDTKFVRLVATADCYLEFDGGAATATDIPLAADTVEYWGVDPGSTLSVYDGTS